MQGAKAEVDAAQRHRLSRQKKHHGSHTTVSAEEATGLRGRSGATRQTTDPSLQVKQKDMDQE